MSSGEQSRRPATHTTQITVVTGDRVHVEGDPRDVARIILDAARGSIMQLAWLTEAETGEDLAITPEHVVVLRAAGSEEANLPAFPADSASPVAGPASPARERRSEQYEESGEEGAS
jgi:hypothetical protein